MKTIQKPVQTELLPQRIEEFSVQNPKGITPGQKYIDKTLRRTHKSSVKFKILICLFIAMGSFQLYGNNDFKSVLGESTDAHLSTSQLPNLDLSGLNFEIAFQDIYIGNFKDVPWKREEVLFGILFGTYVSQFGQKCDQYLPKNKIELTERRCVEKRITKNGYGTIINEQCIKYVNDPTGYYAAPKMYEAMQVLESFQMIGLLDLISGGGDGIGTSLKLTGESQALAMDVAHLFRKNGCNSPGVQHFQKNLRRYAMAEAPIVNTEAIAAKKSKRGSISAHQNLIELIDDLISENSRQWQFNRYISGSVSNVNILSKDSKGLILKAKASYKFRGWSGTKKGSVTLTFDNYALPECLYFFDFPKTCRSASGKVKQAYAKNAYAN